MIKVILSMSMSGVFLLGCSQAQKSRDETATEYSDEVNFSERFVNINHPLVTFDVIETSEDRASIGYDDIELPNTYTERNEQGTFLFAKDAGIVLFIPIKPELMNWEKEGCEFSNIGAKNYQLPDLISMRAECENPRVQTDYLITTSGQIISFNAYRYGEDDSIIRADVYVNFKNLN